MQKKDFKYLYRIYDVNSDSELHDAIYKDIVTYKKLLIHQCSKYNLAEKCTEATNLIENVLACIENNNPYCMIKNSRELERIYIDIMKETEDEFIRRVMNSIYYIIDRYAASKLGEIERRFKDLSSLFGIHCRGKHMVWP